MAKPAGYVNAEFLQKAARNVRHLKHSSYERMDIKAGDHVLDIGCGPGVDTIPMAKRVGENGRVVGLDIDEEMLEKADAYAKQEGVGQIVEHYKGDVLQMPFPDNTFDAIRAERLFQVLPTPYDRPSVFHEMVRVTRPGGRIVVADTDWATASVNYSDSELERRLMTFFALKMRPNGFAGRQFYQLFLQQHLSAVQIEHFPFVMTTLEDTPFGEWLKQEALLAKIATEQEMDAWVTQLSRVSAEGEYYSSVNMILVSGRTTPKS